MQYESIGQILASNAEVRKRLLETLEEVSETEVSNVPEGEKWSIQQIIEHLAMVDQGVVRICRRMVGEAKDACEFSDGKLAISAEFGQNVKRIGDDKLEAPEMVQPTGHVAISDSMKILSENQKAINSMLRDLETYDLSTYKFPHPYFGPLTAVEWLVIAGGHEARHTQQIRRVLTSLHQ